MNATGFNPMRWDCGERGCYNVKHRPKIENFALALPGRIAMTDVDATVEVNGHFLFLEFKSGEPRELPSGQRIYFQRLTALSRRITCVIVCGDAEHMQVRAIRTIYKGVVHAWQKCDAQELFERIQAWAKRVRMQVVPPSVAPA